VAARRHPVRRELLLVQGTTASNLASRVRKGKALSEAAAGLRVGGRFECWGWFRRGGRWDVRQVAVPLEDLGGVTTRPVRRPPARRAK
jgi:hypothetical protein